MKEHKEKLGRWGGFALHKMRRHLLVVVRRAPRTILEDFVLSMTNTAVMRGLLVSTLSKDLALHYSCEL